MVGDRCIAAEGLTGEVVGAVSRRCFLEKVRSLSQYGNIVLSIIMYVVCARARVRVYVCVLQPAARPRYTDDCCTYV